MPHHSTITILQYSRTPDFNVAFTCQYPHLRLTLKVNKLSSVVSHEYSHQPPCETPKFVREIVLCICGQTRQNLIWHIMVLNYIQCKNNESNTASNGREIWRTMMCGGKCGICAIETPVGPVSHAQPGQAFFHLPPADSARNTKRVGSLPRLVEMCCLEVLADCAQFTLSAWIWLQELGPISFSRIALLRLEIRFSATSHCWQWDSVQGTYVREQFGPLQPF